MSFAPWYHPSEPLPSGCSIALIGGGIAGVLCARNLQEQGYEVTLIDRNASLMNGASGNPAAILDPFLTAAPSIEGRIYLAAYLRALSFYAELGVLEVTGLLKKAASEAEQKRFQKIAKTLPPDIVQLDKTDLFFPGSGLVHPPALAELLGGEINMLANCDVTELRWQDGWQIYDNGQKILSTDAVVLCTAHELDRLSPLSLTPVRGQISFIAPDPAQKMVLCKEGYLTPNIGGVRVAGATFGKGDTSLEIREGEHKEILKKCALPPETEITGGRVAVRAMTGDHLPFVGAVPDMDWYKGAYGQLHHGPTHEDFPLARYQPNLYVLAGLGARGFLSAPLLSELLSSLISGTECPLEEELVAALHPARFLIRKLSQKPF